MSTIQQDMTDAAVVWEHLAKRMANELGDGSEEARKQATQIHAAATILHGWVDERKEKLRAAIDDDAPKDTGDAFVAFVAEDTRKEAVDVAPKCYYHTGVGGYCRFTGARCCIHHSKRATSCALYEPKDTDAEFVAFVKEDTRKEERRYDRCTWLSGFGCTNLADTCGKNATTSHHCPNRRWEPYG